MLSSVRGQYSQDCLDPDRVDLCQLGPVTRSPPSCLGVKVVRNVELFNQTLFCHIYISVSSILRSLFLSNAEVTLGMFNYLFLDKFMLLKCLGSKIFNLSQDRLDQPIISVIL